MSDNDAGDRVIFGGITVNRGRMSGRPCIAGTRFPADQLLSEFAADPAMSVSVFAEVFDVAPDAVSRALYAASRFIGEQLDAKRLEGDDTATAAPNLGAK